MPDPFPDPPIDPDLGVDGDVADRAGGSKATGSARPLYLRLGLLVAVGVGGACGTAARALLTTLAAEDSLGTATATLIINVSGCVLLGVLLELLVRLGPDVGVRRTLRLLLGTGFLGGYTTYSTLALDVADGLLAGHWSASLRYAFGSLVLGLLGCVVGVALAGLRRHHAEGRSAAPPRVER